MHKRSERLRPRTPWGVSSLRFLALRLDRLIECNGRACLNYSKWLNANYHGYSLFVQGWQPVSLCCQNILLLLADHCQLLRNLVLGLSPTTTMVLSVDSVSTTLREDMMKDENTAARAGFSSLEL